LKWFCCFLCVLGFGAETIYGVMITGLSPFHKELAHRAIDSFFAQTYPNKHLIVVNDGNYSVADFYPGQITEVRLHEKMKLGALRNVSLQEVPEDAMWVQWDDDDWNHPRRIEEQYNAIMRRGASGCLMAKLYYYVFARNLTMFNSSKKCPGTIMCRKKGEIRYPDNLGVAEDVAYRDDYWEKYKLFSWDNPRHYLLKLSHEKNVWAKGVGRHKRPGVWKGEKASKAYLREVLREHYLFVYDELGVAIPTKLQ
jgi:glycosyltransferase involved in cell wall biosynthesis